MNMRDNQINVDWINQTIGGSKNKKKKGGGKCFIS